MAGHLRRGEDIRGIADARGSSEEAVELAIDRIREKTRRAIVTLAQSPFLAECARELDRDTRQEIIETLDSVDQ